MPTYVYQCKRCDRYIEKFRSVDGRNLPLICRCGGSAARVYLPTSFNMQGHGAMQESDPILKYQFEHLYRD